MAFKPQIILAGGSGFLGRSLVKHLGDRYQFLIISRNADQIDFANAINWPEKPEQLSEYLERSEALINLTGKSVNCRYTKENKREILDSRVKSTQFLAEALKHCDIPPKLWINMSSATIYPHSYTPNTELKVLNSQGFSEEVCEAWEKAFTESETGFIRKTIIRTALVLGEDGGAFPEYVQLANRHLAAKIGDGNAWVSWIHEKDFCEAIDFIIKTRAMGTYNLSSPFPILQSKFMNLLNEKLNIKWALPQEKFMIQIGAYFMGTEAELILKSRYVLPQRLLNDGYKFCYEKMSDAIIDLIQSQSAEKESLSPNTGNLSLPSFKIEKSKLA